MSGMYICKETKCLRCGCALQFWRKENIQLCQDSFGSDMGNMLAGVMSVEVYACPECGKLEFFAGEHIDFLSPGASNTIVCPECGVTHGTALTCPCCGHKYKYCPSCDKLHSEALASCPFCGHDYSKKKGIFSKLF